MRRPQPGLGAKHLFGGWLFLLLSTTARASTPGPFLDLSFGRSLPRPADLRLDQPSRGNSIVLHSIRFDDASFDFPLYYSARVGYWPARASWLGLAIELVHPKLYARLDAPRRVTGRWHGAPVDGFVRPQDQVQRFSISHGENYLAGELLVRRVLRGFDAYAGFGLGPVIAHAENRVDGVANRPRYAVAGLGALGLLGMRLPVVRPAAILAEYKYSRANLEVGIAEGRARLRERTHHLTLGLGWSP